MISAMIAFWRIIENARTLVVLAHLIHPFLGKNLYPRYEIF
jgi:hypothetical protein